MVIRIACLSDVHTEYNRYRDIPDADLYLFAGDLTNYGVYDYDPRELYKGLRFLKTIAEKGKPCLAIRGNHDLGVNREMFEEAGFRDVNHTTVEVLGLMIHGESQTTCFEVPYYADEWTDITADRAKDKMAFLFEPVDIVLSHGPPWSILDNAGYDLEKGVYLHIGSPALYEYVEEYKPGLVVCGHVHEQRGIASHGPTTVINTARAWTTHDLTRNAEASLIRQGDG